MEAPCLATLAGRGVWEKVTAPATLRASAGPTPRTRWNPSIEPKGPLESRSATIRAASAGPIPGRDSSCAAVAMSRSSGEVRGVGREGAGAFVRGRGEPPGDRGRARLVFSALRAESTARSWAPSPRSSDGRSSAGFRHARAPVPSTATAEKNSRTLRSAGVTWRHEAKDASAAERTTILVCASYPVIASRRESADERLLTLNDRAVLRDLCDLCGSRLLKSFEPQRSRRSQRKSHEPRVKKFRQPILMRSIELFSVTSVSSVVQCSSRAVNHRGHRGHREEQE